MSDIDLSSLVINSVCLPGDLFVVVLLGLRIRAWFYPSGMRPQIYLKILVIFVTSILHLTCPVFFFVMFFTQFSYKAECFLIYWSGVCTIAPIAFIPVVFMFLLIDRILVILSKESTTTLFHLSLLAIFLVAVAFGYYAIANMYDILPIIPCPSYFCLAKDHGETVTYYRIAIGLFNVLLSLIFMALLWKYQKRMPLAFTSKKQRAIKTIVIVNIAIELLLAVLPMLIYWYSYMVTDRVQPALAAGVGFCMVLERISMAVTYYNKVLQLRETSKGTTAPKTAAFSRASNGIASKQGGKCA